MSSRAPTPTTRAASVTDGPTVAAALVLCVYTWFIYGLSPSLPLLRDELGTSSAIAGLHSLILALGVVAGGLSGVTLIRRWRRAGAAGRGIVILAGGAALLVAGSLLPAAQLAVTLPAMLIAGFGGALSVNVATALINEHHGAAGPSALTMANAAAAALGLVSPLAVGLATAIGWTWRSALLMTVPLALGVLLLVVRNRSVAAFAAVPAAGSRLSVRGLPVACWLAIAALIAVVAIEFGTVTWTPDLLADRTGIEPGTASGAVAAVIAGIAAGRLLVGWLARRFASLPLFLVGVLVTVVGWALTWSSSVVPAAVAGLVVTGLGMAGQFPLGMSMVMKYSAGQSDRAVGLAGMGLGLAAGLGPFMLGALADRVGVGDAFLVIPGLCLAAAAGAILARRRGGSITAG